MKKILVVVGGGRPNGNTNQSADSFIKGAAEIGREVEKVSSKVKAFIERFYCIAQEDDNPPYGRYEKYPIKDAALLMTSADDYFWTYEQAVSYYKFAIIN